MGPQPLSPSLPNLQSPAAQFPSTPPRFLPMATMSISNTSTSTLRLPTPLPPTISAGRQRHYAWPGIPRPKPPGRSRLRWVGAGGSPVSRREQLSSVSCKATVIDESKFGEEVLTAAAPVLVEFVAEWCGPCRLVAPVVDVVAQEYKDKLKVVKIDHDANPKLIEEYKVYGLPTLIIFKDGKEVPESRREGAITKAKLKEYLNSFLESVTV